ncbi:uracil-DNA glycosylase [Deltaproteobacteria bacterium OttesenSCG-928-K17]|nr:uracil-DNA glycosylase [Deltaproteobacteria bacterium OttesenSCG-928-K17]
MSSRVNCRLCRHYYVTWQPRHPNGCRAMGFVSLQMPAAQVFLNSGQECQLFSPKRSGGR